MRAGEDAASLPGIGAEDEPCLVLDPLGGDGYHPLVPEMLHIPLAVRLVDVEPVCHRLVSRPESLSVLGELGDEREHHPLLHREVQGEDVVVEPDELLHFALLNFRFG